MDDQELLRYSRHLLLEEIGVEGQARIAASRMLVIGADPRRGAPRPAG